MSGTTNIVSAAQLAVSVVGGESQALLFSTPRYIGAIKPDIAIEEIHRDELQTTDHQVEAGAAITDHAYKMPPQLEMRIGFSDAGLFNGPGYTKKMMARLVALQNTRVPMMVSTGKRLYSHMLITGISSETIQGQEYSAIISVRLKQILIARTSTTTVPPAKAAQAAPATSAATETAGTKQAAPVAAPAQSLLSRMGSALGIGS